MNVDFWSDKTPVDLKKNFENQLLDNHWVDWSNKIQTVSKLRTYREFESEFKTEKYLLSNMTKLEKSIFAQFRCGIFTPQSRDREIFRLFVQKRTCNICNSMKLKMRFISLFKCACYHDLRQSLTDKATETKSNFLLLNDVEKLRHFVINHFIYAAKFTVDAMQRRKSVLYN